MRRSWRVRAISGPHSVLCRRRWPEGPGLRGGGICGAPEREQFWAGARWGGGRAAVGQLPGTGTEAGPCPPPQDMAAPGVLPFPGVGAGDGSTPRPCGGFGAHAALSVGRAGPDPEGSGGQPAAGGAVHSHAGPGAGAAGGARPAGAGRGEPRDSAAQGTGPGRRPDAPIPTRARGTSQPPEPQFPLGISCWEGRCPDELQRLGSQSWRGNWGSRSLPATAPHRPRGLQRPERGGPGGHVSSSRGHVSHSPPALPVRA